jgi:uncharacterized membrane protein
MARLGELATSLDEQASKARDKIFKFIAFVLTATAVMNVFEKLQRGNVQDRWILGAAVLGLTFLWYVVNKDILRKQR